MSLPASSVVPFIALGGGVRQEWIGSFSRLRYLAGTDIGVRALMGNRAAIRAEYSFRRVLHDPVADFSEHRIMLGISILFRNSGGR
jgi:hypothetical protein